MWIKSRGPLCRAVCSSAVLWSQRKHYPLVDLLLSLFIHVGRDCIMAFLM
uniref:Uncharacterized protein n=1 Tax=Anguilla anguilla TaxID=7936 RepID=A0A0E9RJH5_ANGAN